MSEEPLKLDSVVLVVSDELNSKYKGKEGIIVHIQTFSEPWYWVRFSGGKRVWFSHKELKLIKKG